MRYLACPIDHGPLELVSWEAKEIVLTVAQRDQAGALGIETDDLARDVTTGLVNNPRLRLSYPIYRSVPRMLTFRSGVHTEFERAHGDRMARECPGYAFPSEPPTPGEEDMLRSFSTEWTNYQ